jgi:two-component system, LuxR family, sensor kinase FixL
MPISETSDEFRSYAHQRGRRRPGRRHLWHRGQGRLVGSTVVEARKSQAALHAAQTSLAHASRVATLAELSATIAHEVKQPLAAIVMTAETSLRWLSRDEPNIAKVEQLMRHVVSAARRASDIVQHIRSMATKHEPELTPIDLSEVVDEALLLIRHEIESKSIDLSVKLGVGLPFALADRIQLQQVIVNLLVNSIHAVTQVEGSMRRISLEAGADKDDAVFFSIRDSGPGIPDENLDRVFESFFTTKKDGMGIGLAICQSVITTHGGSIAVSNHPEGGAQFRFTLPAMHPAPLDDAAKMLRQVRLAGQTPIEH